MITFFNRKIIYAKPTLPRRRKKRNPIRIDWGSIGEALLIISGIALFLWACFH